MSSRKEIKKIKLLVVNEGYSNNLGDQVINKSFDSLIIKNSKIRLFFEDLNRTTLDQNYKKNKNKIYKKNFLFPLKVLLHRLSWFLNNFKRIVFAVRNCDYVVFGGGQLLIDNNIFPYSIYLWSLVLRFFEKKYSFFSIGTQGEYNIFSRMCLKNSLKSADHIYVRDDLSKKKIYENFQLITKITYDLGFLYPRNILLTSPTHDGYNLLGVVDFNVFKNFNKNKISKEVYFDIWIKIIGGEKFLQSYKLFYSTAEDRSECFAFLNYIQTKYEVKMDILENFTLNEFIKNIVFSKKIISGRMHSLIVAKRFNIKYKTFILSEKLSQFDLIYKNLEIEKIQKKIRTDFNSIFK